MNRLLRAAVALACVAFFARPVSAQVVVTGGVYTVTAADVAGPFPHVITLAIAPNPLTSVTTCQVQVVEAAPTNNISTIVSADNINPNADVEIDKVGATVVVSDPNTFSFVAGQQIRWIAVGPPAVPAVPAGVGAPRGGSVAIPGAGPVTIPTGYASITSAFVQLVNAANAQVITYDISVKFAGGNIIVAAGPNRALGNTQVLRWIAIGN